MSGFAQNNFGTLRELVHIGNLYGDRLDQLWQLLVQCRDADPVGFKNIWLVYISSFSNVLGETYFRECSTMAELSAAIEVAPFAKHSLDATDLSLLEAKHVARHGLEYVYALTIRQSNNSIDILDELARSTHTYTVHELYLYGALYRSRYGKKIRQFAHVTHLDLSENDVGPAFVGSFAGETTYADLEWLNLNDNLLGDSGVAKLCQVAQMPSLRSLDLGNNGVSDEGVVTLARSGQFRQLSELSLSGNSITCVGLSALLEASFASRLRWLFLFGNRMGRECVDVILEARETLAECRVGMRVDHNSQSSLDALERAGIRICNA